MEHYIQQWLGIFPFWLVLLAIFACILLLSFGADTMIDGAVALAQRTGLPHIIIGATIISLGTTLPEAFVSVMAAWMGNPGLALGNGVGSIIADTGLVFGLMCLLSPIPLNRFILNRTGWVQIGSATLLVILAIISWFQTSGIPVIGHKVGITFLVLLALYLYVSYYWAKAGGEQVILGEPPTPDAKQSIPKGLFQVIIGLVLVIVGARFIVPSASEVALRIGVPEDIIAATIVALGTSLPELVTGISAVRKGHPEIMVGNIVGADVLNCLFVIGAAAVAAPLQIPPSFFKFHFPAMMLILISFRVFIAVNQKGRFPQWQGGWLLLIYITYIILQYTLNLT